MAFLLFIVVNAVLLIRPAEIVPDLQGIELYFYVITACMLFAAGDVLKYLSGTPPELQPVTLCWVGILCIIPLAPLISGNAEEAWRTFFYFAKVFVYYLLLVSLVTTPGRLHALVRWVLFFFAIVMAVAVLEYHGLIKLPTVQALQESMTDSEGRVVYFDRLQFSGIFNDPNELCMWLAALVPLCLYNLARDPVTPRRLLWLVTLLLYGYGIYLTRSRGGFLALVAGLGTFCWVRWGPQRAALIGTIGLPVLLALFAGRQTDIDASNSTGQTRIRLWSDWLATFRGSPVFGEGMPLIDMTKDQIKEKRAMYGMQNLAHNSFLQAFADLGFIGGCLFLGAFGLSLWSLWRLSRRGTLILDPPLRDFQPCLLGAFAAYCVGMLTLSLCYVVPTTLILGLAVAGTRVVRTWPPVPPPRLDAAVLGRFALAGIVFLIGVYLFVRVFVNWG